MPKRRSTIYIHIFPVKSSGANGKLLVYGSWSCTNKLPVYDSRSGTIKLTVNDSLLGYIIDKLLSVYGIAAPGRRMNS